MINWILFDDRNAVYCISNLETVHERTVVYIRCYTYIYYIVSYIYIVVICKLMSCWLFTVATTRLPSDCRVPITEVACCRWCRLIFNSRDVHSGCPSTRLKTERLAGWRCRWSSKVNRHARITRPSGRLMTTTREWQQRRCLNFWECNVRQVVAVAGSWQPAVRLGLAWPRSWPPDSATSSIVQVPNSQFQTPDLPPASLVLSKRTKRAPKSRTKLASFLFWDSSFPRALPLSPLSLLSTCLFLSLCWPWRGPLNADVDVTRWQICQIFRAILWSFFANFN